MLERAFLEQIEPQEMVAKELARIYLLSYRLDRAARAIERWRALAPQDPEPCLWSNEIASRSDADTAVLIQNYRAALDRDPEPRQGSSGSGAAIEQGSPIRRSRARIPQLISKRKPKDTAAFLGLGQERVPAGQHRRSRPSTSKPRLETNPRDPETLKELGQLDLRLGRIRAGVRAAQALERDRAFRPRSSLLVRPGAQARRRC